MTLFAADKTFGAGDGCGTGNNEEETMQAAAAADATGRNDEARSGFSAALPGWLRGMLERLQNKGGSRRMKLAETLNLGGKRQLALVICDGRRYLVGLGGDSVHAIEALPPSENGAAEMAINSPDASGLASSAPGRFS